MNKKAIIAHHEATPAMLKALQIINDGTEGELSLRAITEGLGKDGVGSAQYIVQRLEDLGLVQRKVDNGRKQFTGDDVTETGKAVLEMEEESA